MSKRNQEWSACIESLMKSHEWTYRDVENLCEGNVSAATIHGWVSYGKVPMYETARTVFHWLYEIKSAVTIEEVKTCFSILGFQVPIRWMAEATIKVAEVKLRQLDSLTEEGVEVALNAIREVLEESEPKGREGREVP